MKLYDKRGPKMAKTPGFKAEVRQGTMCEVQCCFWSKHLKPCGCITRSFFFFFSLKIEPNKKVINWKSVKIESEMLGILKSGVIVSAGARKNISELKHTRGRTNSLSADINILVDETSLKIVSSQSELDDPS